MQPSKRTTTANGLQSILLARTLLLILRKQQVVLLPVYQRNLNTWIVSCKSVKNLKSKSRTRTSNSRQCPTTRRYFTHHYELHFIKRKRNSRSPKRQEKAQSAWRMRVIEKLIRSDNAREMNELRQKLASDGARLGRIVYTRAGMRAVERWEEGNASKQLLKESSRAQDETGCAGATTKRLRIVSEQLEKNSKENDALNALEVIEAEESVRLHFDSIQQTRGRTCGRRAGLDLEKADHIRSLKRLASEDASRFRSRPKVCHSCRICDFFPYVLLTSSMYSRLLLQQLHGRYILLCSSW